MQIRKFESKDRKEVRQITYETAFMGEAASVFFDGQEIISDALSLYFTDYEPESCFVCQVDQEIAGYLFGAKNMAVSEKLISKKIIPRIFWQALTSNALLKKKNIVFIFKVLLSLIKGEFVAPDFKKMYPAILHINIKDEYRNLGIGSKLISTYLEYLKKEKITGVHLATMSKEAGNFFTKRGFGLLYETKRSYFSHILHKDVPLLIYGRRCI
ncbi:MAG: GNAT family N-acetyltransferase [Candidatus Omnitrophota bacterium]